MKISGDAKQNETPGSGRLQRLVRPTAFERWLKRAHWNTGSVAADPSRQAEVDRFFAAKGDRKKMKAFFESIGAKWTDDVPRLVSCER